MNLIFDLSLRVLEASVLPTIHAAAACGRVACSGLRFGKTPPAVQSRGWHCSLSARLQTRERPGMCSHKTLSARAGSGADGLEGGASEGGGRTGHPRGSVSSAGAEPVHTVRKRGRIGRSCSTSGGDASGARGGVVNGKSRVISRLLVCNCGHGGALGQERVFRSRFL